MMSITAALLYGALVAAAVLVARALRALYKFRRLEQDIPGPPSLPVLGNALDLVGLSHERVFPALMALWGGRRTLSRLTILNKLHVFVTDPVDLEAVTKRRDLADKPHVFYDFIQAMAPCSVIWINGELWRRHRRSLQPAFHVEILESSVEHFVEEARDFVKRVVPGQEVDVCENTRRAISRSFLRSSITQNAIPDFDDFVSRCMNFFDEFVQSIMERTVNFVLWPDFIYFRTAGGRRLRCGLADVEAMFSDFIEKVRADLDGRTTAEDSPGRRRRTLVEILMLQGRRPGEYRMSDEEIRDELKANMGAAIETTLSALSFIFKVLSLRPDVQERLHRELDEVFDGTQRPVQADDLPRLEYTERVIKEVLRLFPPVPLTGRQVHRDTELASYKLPAGTTLLLNVFGAHRDPAHWPDPLLFDPDRFLPERGRGRHPCAFLPFSSGARNCLGMQYAMMNMKTFLATVLRALRVERADDPFTDIHQLPLSADLSLRIVGGARVVFARRPTQRRDPCET